MMDEKAAHQGRRGIPHGTLDCAPELAGCQARTPIGSVSHSRPLTPGVGDNLPDCYEAGESNCELKPNHAIKTRAESDSANGGEQSLQRQVVMIEAAGRAIQFDGYGKAGGEAGRDAKKQSQAKTVSDSEDDGVSYDSSEKPQRTMLATKQIIGKIEAAQHIQAGSGNADGRDGMVVHPRNCRRYTHRNERERNRER